MESGMSRWPSLTWSWATFWVLLMAIPQIQGLAISYCSPQNTGSNYPTFAYQYMSNGECGTRCSNSGYVFAVIQGQDCWCSNYAPSSLQSTYNCNEVCPGFGSEWCGSTAAGLYGYFQVNAGPPSGTFGISSSTSSSVSTILSSPGPSTVVVLAPATSLAPSVVTTDPPQTPIQIVSSLIAFSTPPRPSVSSQTPHSPSPSTRSSSSSSSTSTPPPSSSSTSSTTAPPEVITSITTVTGQVRTVLVTPTPTSDGTLGQSSTGPPQGGVSTGKVVGAVVGAAIGLGILVGIGVWFCLRRRHRRNMRNLSPEGSYTNSTASGPISNGIPSRQVSQLSSAGLLVKGPRIQTTGLSAGNDPRSADSNWSSNFDRRSMGTDQRLNPLALYIHDESRMSDVSLQDNQDYSRQLRVANPDP